MKKLPYRLALLLLGSLSGLHAYEGRSLIERARPVKLASDPTRARARFETLLRRAQNGESLAPADLGELDLGQLRLLRNTSYARHGYVFRTSDLRALFGATSWYRADPAYRESRLTPSDAGNIGLTRERERAFLAGIGGETLRDFELRSRAHAWQAVHQ